MVVPCPRHPNVLGPRRPALALELQGQDLLENPEVHPDQAQDGCQRDGVLHEIAPDAGGQGLDGERTELEFRRERHPA